ncbi:MAG: zinc-binding alcohol dehydrogenase family protein [Vicinamibacterales bacterium]
MRNVVVYGPGADEALPRFLLEGATVPCAVVDGPAPAFDPSAPEHASHVLVKKRGFSVNYRDRALILSMVVRAPYGSYYPVGSDFVGEVVATGPAVRSLAPGDRVIGNAAYPASGAPGVRPGVPVNSASRELQVFHEVKVAKVPDTMSDEVAACFTIGAQTSFSMVRRLRLQAGERVLVTAGSSNTSLFAIHALANQPVTTSVITTSARHVERLRALGVAEVILLDRGRPSWTDQPAMRQVLEDAGPFDAVIDPFFDINLGPATEVMRPGGRYISCGMLDQHTHLGIGTTVGAGPAPVAVMLRLLMGNLEILGNCIGTDADLRAAIDAHAAGRYPVVMDRTFSGRDAAAFFDRSYNAPDRFGKVAFIYD